MIEQEELFKKLKSNSMEMNGIQDYIKKVINIRGFKDQAIEQTMLLLLEEVGELAKAIRKEKTDMSIDKDKLSNYDSVENEIADVFIVLNSICNTLNINLYSAFYQKEKMNIKRNWQNNEKN